MEEPSITGRQGICVPGPSAAPAVPRGADRELQEPDMATDGPGRSCGCQGLQEHAPCSSGFGLGREPANGLLGWRRLVGACPSLCLGSCDLCRASAGAAKPWMQRCSGLQLCHPAQLLPCCVVQLAALQCKSLYGQRSGSQGSENKCEKATFNC